MRLRFLIPAAAMGVLAACSQGADEAGGSANAAAFTAETAACGVEQLEPMVWGREVSSSGLKVQELRDGVRNLRVWSEADAALADEDGVLTGEVTGPAWIAADLSAAKSKMLHVPAGTVRVRVAGEAFECEENAELAAQLEDARAAEAAAEAQEELSEAAEQEPAADAPAEAETEQNEGPAEDADGTEQESEEQ
ncbi:MAG: hypothetical protein H2040_08290 [Euryhalocaulis sp.]|uniref:hypothetical protein n=1 Tax=Euryhalocaulis sp. TaxID=2744307 RepID=UPI0017D89102|nr:hypothetical protein [Euryhalocaulis sp.]MBA4801850.1 hypothetical protein [Euryhalocaulis sp.]